MNVTKHVESLIGLLVYETRVSRQKVAIVGRSIPPFLALYEVLAFDQFFV